MAAPANERHEGAQDQDDHADDKQNFDHAMYHGRMAPHVHHKEGRPSRPNLLRWKPWEGSERNGHRGIGCGAAVA